MSESHHPLVVFFCNTFIKILYLAHVVAAVYFPGPHLQVSVMLVYFFFCRMKMSSVGLAAPVTYRSTSPPSQHIKPCYLGITFFFAISISLSCRNPATTADVLPCSHQCPSHLQECFSLSWCQLEVSLEVVLTVQICRLACQNAAKEVINSVEFESLLYCTVWALGAFLKAIKLVEIRKKNVMCFHVCNDWLAT